MTPLKAFHTRGTFVVKRNNQTFTVEATVIKCRPKSREIKIQYRDDRNPALLRRRLLRSEAELARFTPYEEKEEYP